MTFLYILLAIVILLFMVLIHEFGHYLAGKILKFKITEFSVGFGFSLFSHTNKKTGEKFSLRAFPLGGYCAFAGEDSDENTSSPDDFNNQKPWKRIIVFLAGVTANFITAILFSWILLSTVGYDTIVVNHGKNITFNETVYETQFRQGDIIKEIGGTNVNFAFGGTFVDLLGKEEAKAKAFYEENGVDASNLYTFNVKVKRDGQIVGFDVIYFPFETTDSNGDTVKIYLMGLESAKGEEPCTTAYVYSAWEGFCRSFEVAFGFAWVVLKSLWMLITFQIPITQVGGTITTISTIATYAAMSMKNVLVFIPLIAANLAVFNLLPFPALDGSHVLFTLIEQVRGKPINRKVENTIHFVGICILFAFVVIVDIIHFVVK